MYFVRRYPLITSIATLINSGIDSAALNQKYWAYSLKGGAYTLLRDCGVFVCRSSDKTFTLEQASRVQRGSRCQALLFLYPWR